MNYPFVSLGPALHWLALFLLFALTAVGIAVAVLLAMLPGKIAAARHHPQAAAVTLLGWLGLPTGILWVVALVWAYWRYPGMNGRTNAETTAIAQDFAMQLNKLDHMIALLEAKHQGETS